MNENQKNQKETPKTVEGAQTSAWKRLLAKKWVFPATYMAAAAIILTLVWAYQGSDTKSLTDETVGLDVKTVTGSVNGPAVPAGANAETMQWPVKDLNAVEVSLGYYDKDASTDVREAALIQYGDEVTPHVGIDFAREDNEAFDVLAVMSGKVTHVGKDPLAGTTLEITHSNGLVSVYQSLADVKVAKDATVKKGDVLAKAGRSELEKDSGVHLHFEVRQGEGGPSVNPDTLIPQN